MEPLELHERAQRVFGDVLAHVTDDDLGRATPCTAWTVADLIDHLVTGNQHIAALLGTAPAPLPDGSPAERYEAAARQAHDAFARPGALDATISMPFGDVPGRVLAAIRSGDHYAHAWDLAMAIGADTDLDHEVGEEVFAQTAPVLPPQFRGEGKPFAPEQPCPPDRPVADRYAAFVGRVVH